MCATMTTTTETVAAPVHGDVRESGLESVEQKATCSAVKGKEAMCRTDRLICGYSGDTRADF